MTLIVNLMGAPCAGKSTVRADLFRTLKQQGINCEEVYETAKKLSWTKRNAELGVQPYIFGKQLRDVLVLMGKVDVIITDSPLILCEFYNQKYCPGVFPESFGTCVVEQFKRMGGLNVFIDRVGTYNPSGRNQTEEEANAIGDELLDLLAVHQIEYMRILGSVEAASFIADEVHRRLNLVDH
jgi:hypothetical protein